MGLIMEIAEAESRQHTPKVAFVAPAASYTASSGKAVDQHNIDLLVRALSMGKLHHAMMGTAAVAIGTAAAIPGTLVNTAAGGGERNQVVFGHPSGTLKVGAEATMVDGQWQVTKASMSRSARVLMEGWVKSPGHVLVAPLVRSQGRNTGAGDPPARAGRRNRQGLLAVRQWCQNPRLWPCNPRWDE